MMLSYQGGRIRSKDLLSSYEYDGDNSPVIEGSTLGALNVDQKWSLETVEALMDAVDSWIELPVKNQDKPFLMQ